MSMVIFIYNFGWDIVVLMMLLRKYFIDDSMIFWGRFCYSQLHCYSTIFLPLLLQAPVYFCKLYIFLQLTHQKDFVFCVNKVYFWFLLVLTTLV